jgi:hypothetical protein
MKVLLEFIQKLKEMSANGSEDCFSLCLFRPETHRLLDRAKSFITKILSAAISLVATEFFRIWAYLANLGSLTT